ncbi:hypothetical protein B0T17DRAFT_510204 [Bombardia bombarda]|uniref:Uncharacterized protein n=1 Tax=Bombardia bombarda TaxID=252184 RepID=A0AA39WHR2_9PEZI|nr:hypothetical protein B0T17DRAFT_510204 [Bombardia bombarda]
MPTLIPHHSSDTNPAMQWPSHFMVFIYTSISLGYLLIGFLLGTTRYKKYSDLPACCQPLKIPTKHARDGPLSRVSAAVFAVMVFWPLCLAYTMLWGVVYLVWASFYVCGVRYRSQQQQEQDRGQARRPNAVLKGIRAWLLCEGGMPLLMWCRPLVLAAERKRRDRLDGLVGSRSQRIVPDGRAIPTTDAASDGHEPKKLSGREQDVAMGQQDQDIEMVVVVHTERSHDEPEIEGDDDGDGNGNGDTGAVDKVLVADDMDVTSNGMPVDESPTNKGGQQQEGERQQHDGLDDEWIVLGRRSLLPTIHEQDSEEEEDSWDMSHQFAMKLSKQDQ